jgi:hypothetical protein
MSLDSICKVTISATPPTVTRQGYGIPMILGYHSRFAELVRTYTSVAAMATDGFVATDPEYIAASKLESQTPPVATWMVGRRTHAPTQVVVLTPTPVNSAVYTVTIFGTTYTYTADTSTSAQEISTGLKALIAADTTLTGVLTPTDAGAVLTLTGASGKWFSWTCGDNTGNANGMGSWASVQDTSTDGGANADITAVAAASGAWYAFVTTHQNEVEGKILMAWAEANGRFFGIDLADTIMKTSSTADLAYYGKSQAYARSFVAYHQIMGEFLSIAWMGSFLSYDPGTYTAKFKTLVGVTPDVLTASEVGYLVGTFSAGTYTGGKNANIYQTVSGVAIMGEGWDCSGEFIDKVIYVDALVSGIQEDEFGVFTSLPKVGFTDAGVALLEAPLRANLQHGLDIGALASYTVNAAAVSTVPAANRVARNYPYLTFVANLAGAIHSLAVAGAVIGA